MSEREPGAKYNLTSESIFSIQSVFYAFSKVLTRRICFNNQELLQLVIISLTLDSGVILGSEVNYNCIKWNKIEKTNHIPDFWRKRIFIRI